MRIHLREKFANFLLAERRVAIAEKQIDAAFDFHLQAGFIARVDPFGEAGRSEALLRSGENFGVVFAGDDAAEAVGFQAFGEAQRA